MNLEYLNALKQKGNFTVETIAKVSGVPESTVKNVLSGKTEDPCFDTVAAIIRAMGGSLDEYYKKTPTGKEVDMNIVVAIKELYEARIADLKEHITVLKRERKWLFASACVLVGFIVSIVVIDVCVGTVGWFRY